MYKLSVTAENLERVISKQLDDISPVVEMADDSNIKLSVNFTLADGSEIKFKAPADCSSITGLVISYPDNSGNTVTSNFVLTDAHGNDVGSINNLFAKNAVVKVILDVTSGQAFVQNADTNAYIEGQLARKAEMDDNSIGKATWSSKKIIDTICPTCTEKGTVVSFRPLMGYPLSIVSILGSAVDSTLVLHQTGDDSEDSCDYIVNTPGVSDAVYYWNTGDLWSTADDELICKLEPQVIMPMDGTNTFSVEGGPDHYIIVTYKMDPNEYWENRIAALEEALENKVDK